MEIEATAREIIIHQQDRGSPVEKGLERKLPNIQILRPKLKHKIQGEEDCLKPQLLCSNYTNSAENLQPLHGEQTYWPAQ